MKRSPLFSTVACSAAVAIPLFVGAPAYAATACADLAKLTLPQTKITRAERVPAGDFNAPGVQQPLKVPALCRVAGTVEPAINFETWMPLENWNGRFQGLGLGAFYGKLPYTPMAQSLDRGYAVGGTDTGHQSESDDGTWAMSNGALNQQIVEDWAHRGIHEMSVKSQAIVESVYGIPARAAERATASSP